MPMMTLSYVLLFMFLISSVISSSYRPVVLMHGVGANAESMNDVVSWIKEAYPGIYIKNVEIGDGVSDSWHWSMPKQVASFAQQVIQDENLKSGFDLIGYSQGGLITRAYIEQYNKPKVHNYVSWVGPHSGVFGVPEFNKVYCPIQDTLCDFLDKAFSDILKDKYAAYLLQDYFSFASYWKDPFDLESYLMLNRFLPDLNNERLQKVQTKNRNVLQKF